MLLYRATTVVAVKVGFSVAIILYKAEAEDVSVVAVAVSGICQRRRRSLRLGTRKHKDAVFRNFSLVEG